MLRIIDPSHPFFGSTFSVLQNVVVAVCAAPAYYRTPTLRFAYVGTTNDTDCVSLSLNNEKKINSDESNDMNPLIRCYLTQKSNKGGLTFNDCASEWANGNVTIEFSKSKGNGVDLTSLIRPPVFFPPPILKDVLYSWFSEELREMGVPISCQPLDVIIPALMNCKRWAIVF